MTRFKKSFTDQSITCLNGYKLGREVKEKGLTGAYLLLQFVGFRRQLVQSSAMLMQCSSTMKGGLVSTLYP